MGKFLFFVIIVVIIIVVVEKGVFRKDAPCKHCGKPLKGTEQVCLGDSDSEFVLCKECYHKIHPQIRSSAKSEWDYDDYEEYLKWDEETKELRKLFKPTFNYYNGLLIDAKNMLFSMPSYHKDSIVFRFSDLYMYDINFVPKEVSNGILGNYVKGHEMCTVYLKAPNVIIDNYLRYDVEYRYKQSGIINPKYSYSYSDEFSEAIQRFSLCAETAMNGQHVNENQIDEVQKALALFMFDSMDEVTVDNLKKQRNSLIKAFHPDTNDTEDSYAQKINAAYDLLSNFVKEK